MKKKEEERDLPLEELRNLLRSGNKALEFGLTHFAGHIRGTLQWKLSKRLELHDMVDFVGLPTFFITLSAADSHWTDLQIMMKRHEEGNSTNFTEEVDDAGRNGRVVRNPHMVDAFFIKRLRLFLEHVIGHDKMNHFWFIFEWQHRGSIHAHGLLWLKDAPFNNAEEVVKHGELYENNFNVNHGIL